MDGFEWDAVKEIQNIAKHGIDFETASSIWKGSVYELIDRRRDYGETRAIATGMAGDRILVVIYTARRENRRIISARRAKASERKRFEEEIARREKSPLH